MEGGGDKGDVRVVILGGEGWEEVGWEEEDSYVLWYHGIDIPTVYSA